MDTNSLQAEITITRELDCEELEKRLAAFVGSENTPETRSRIADAVRACVKTDVDVHQVPNATGERPETRLEDA